MSDPVGLDEPSDFGTGMTVRITSADVVDVVSALPGDVGGPSVVLTLEFLQLLQRVDRSESDDCGPVIR